LHVLLTGEEVVAVELVLASYVGNVLLRTLLSRVLVFVLRILSIFFHFYIPQHQIGGGEIGLAVGGDLIALLFAPRLLSHPRANPRIRTIVSIELAGNARLIFISRLQHCRLPPRPNHSRRFRFHQGLREVIWTTLHNK
jgi:hypothetical protein